MLSTRNCGKVEWFPFQREKHQGICKRRWCTQHLSVWSRTGGFNSSVTLPQILMVQILADYPRGLKNTVDGQVLVCFPPPVVIFLSVLCPLTWRFIIPSWEKEDIKEFLWKSRKSLLFCGMEENLANHCSAALEMLKNQYQRLS